MKSTNSETGEGAVVQLSLWPAICKVSADGDGLLIDQEVVWTSAVQSDDELDAVLDMRDDKTQVLKLEDSMEL